MCDTELLSHDEYGSDGRRISDYMIAVLQLFFCLCLQCFDAVVWASGRASGL